MPARRIEVVRAASAHVLHQAPQLDDLRAARRAGVDRQAAPALVVGGDAPLDLLRGRPQARRGVRGCGKAAAGAVRCDPAGRRAHWWPRAAGGVPCRACGRWPTWMRRAGAGRVGQVGRRARAGSQAPGEVAGQVGGGWLDRRGGRPEAPHRQPGVRMRQRAHRERVCAAQGRAPRCRSAARARSERDFTGKLARGGMYRPCSGWCDWWPDERFR
jgi:hypothetical protein